MWGPVPPELCYLLFNLLTLWCSMLPYGCSYNFWQPGTLTLSPERQSALMSKNTKDGLIWSGTGCFIAAPVQHSWRQRVKPTVMNAYRSVKVFHCFQCQLTRREVHKSVALDTLHSLDGTVRLKLLLQLRLVYVRSQVTNVQHFHLHHVHKCTLSTHALGDGAWHSPYLHASRQTIYTVSPKNMWLHFLQ